MMNHPGRGTGVTGGTFVQSTGGRHGLHGSSTGLPSAAAAAGAAGDVSAAVGPDTPAPMGGAAAGPDTPGPGGGAAAPAGPDDGGWSAQGISAGIAPAPPAAG